MEKQIFELSIIKLIQHIKKIVASKEKTKVILKRHDNIIDYITYIDNKKISADSIKLLNNSSLKDIYDCLKQAFFDSYIETYKVDNDSFNIKFEINNVSIEFSSRNYFDKKWFNEQAKNTFQKVKRRK